MGQRRTVVTGANGGIGRAVCTVLLNKGYGLVALGRNPDALNEAVDSLGEGSDDVTRVMADIRDVKKLEASLSEVENVHALVVNAGICRQAKAMDDDADQVWEEVLASNLSGAWNTVRSVLPKMGTGGRIVFVSSGLGKLGRAGYSAYAASKHGILGLAKCLALELSPREITVNSVCPGWVDTEMAAADLRRTAVVTGKPVVKIEDQAMARIPIGRMVAPEEVASLIAWLISDEAASVTGQAYNISGGEFGL